MYSSTLVSLVLTLVTVYLFVQSNAHQESTEGTCDGSSEACNHDEDNFIISKIGKAVKPTTRMDLLYSTPLALTWSYLTRFFYGESSIEELSKEFHAADIKNAELAFDINDQEFDFIVVGSGSAGSAVARRLVEDPANYKVLVLEAGGNPFPLTSVPSLAFLLVNNPHIDWMERTVPQKFACQGFKNESITLTRGKGLGGSSNLNIMINMRGNPNDYDRWADLAGNEEWKFENILPFFKKLETYNGPFPCEKYHGQDGPINVEKMPFEPLKDEWEALAKELGYDYKDPNGDSQDESFFPFSATIKDATRLSTHRGYLYPVLNRPNLVIRSYSTATKIEFDSSNRAIGVHYETKKSNGESSKHYATATKEIVLSSGTLGSSKLLMLSGVGPKSHLESLNIPVKMDLPVGQNMQDHVLTFIGPFSYEKSKTTQPDMGEDLTPDALLEYLNKRTGPFSATGLGIAGGALIASSSGSKKWPDLYYTVSPTPMVPETAYILGSAFNYKDGHLQKYFEPTVGQNIFFIGLCLSLPKSTGEVKLTSSDPEAELHIDPKYFSHPDDVQTMLEGTKLALKMVEETETMKKIGAKLTPGLLPGCESFENSNSDNDDYWTCFIRHWTQTMWHFTSTNKMGSGAKDKNSVVDSNLRVVGTTGLRVIDNSIQPLVVTTNTNIPAIVIGEKGADLILKSWRK